MPQEAGPKVWWDYLHVGPLTPAGIGNIPQLTMSWKVLQEHGVGGGEVCTGDGF